jgi:hypothetical protein
MKATDKKRRIRIRYPVYRSKNPDPYQNDTDSEHWQPREASFFLQSLVLGRPGLRIHIHFIRIQNFRLNTNPDPDPIRIQGFVTKKIVVISKTAVSYP